MLNLVQVQEKLKDLPMQAVAAYANGSNPMVPPYVALGELNRRKQMEASAAAEQAQAGGEQPTVKDQMEQQLGLMNLQQQRQAQGAQQMGQAMANNPNIPPQGGGEQPVQMANGGMPRDRMQGNPQDAIKKLMLLKAMKERMPRRENAGISNLPVKRDFMQRGNFAKGGIVAFQDNPNQPVSVDMPSDQDMRDFDQASALFEAERKAAPAEEKIMDSKDLLKALIQKAGKEVSPEQMYEQIKRAREITGVKENPYEESNKERAALKELRQKDYENQPRRELREFMLGVANAKPGQGLGVALAGGSERTAKEEERFRTLRDQEKVQELQWLKADEKERDAIARGDAKGILEAQQQKDELNYKISKLSTERDQLAYQKFMMAVNNDPYLESLIKKGKYYQEGSEEYNKNINEINQYKEKLAKEAGFEYKFIPFKSTYEPEKPKEKKKSWFGGDDDKKPEASKVDTGIPPGLPSGTKYFDRTPDGKPIYLLPNGKKIVQE